ncbi:MAG: T9SS type A sorting domain-containing protein [Saprospiraceae bacterium]|nr:T9SS type A sorting domain-containing protein [Saprospiraceae bacterium]
MRKRLLLLVTCLSFAFSGWTQHSIAREWNETLLSAIRREFARPTVHARNLFHTSIAMYDVWAAYDSTAQTYFLGKTHGDFFCPFEGVSRPDNVEEAIKEAISYACYTLMEHRFNTSRRFDGFAPVAEHMAKLGYDVEFTDTDYTTGSPAALGNYIAEQLIEFGLQDGSNERFSHANQFYQPVNLPMKVDEAESPPLADPNRWQPLSFTIFIGQSGQQGDNTPQFLSPEWGYVQPFALQEKDLTIHERDGNEYWVYHDPGPPPFLNRDDPLSLMEAYKWNFSLVALWSAHMGPFTDEVWDISPASIGNLGPLPSTLEEYKAFYDPFGGGDNSQGHDINPHTGLPYEPQLVKRGDYARVLAEFWADGPDSETPPGHWFTILNYVNDHPLFEKKFAGKGEVLDDLEWDVKAYLTLGGAMHDAAISAWGIKGYYDYIRPVSAIRYMGRKGQSSDPNLPSFDPEGLPLVPGYIELVKSGETLAGDNDENVGKIKLYAWRGPDAITDPREDAAGVNWVLAEEWWPYQRPTFVTPPFAGYVSGHSTFSRAAAEVLTLITGDEYFPGGMGEFYAPKNEFLVFEQGPSTDVILQWATYRDASDQTSLSRIWGGIHPPVDDIPGRIIGEKVGIAAYNHAIQYFFIDQDQDGAFEQYDCDDFNASIFPGAPEICDGIDNNCNGLIDEGIPVMIYFVDADGDGFGNPALSIDTCALSPPTGYANNGADCDDSNAAVNPVDSESCNPSSDNCGPNQVITRFFKDHDEDNFGDAAAFMDTCLMAPPMGYVTNDLDCDDSNPAVNPAAEEICDGLDNNCDGLEDEHFSFQEYFRDQDGDGFGNAAEAISSCLTSPPMGYVWDNTDCDDTNGSIYPSATDEADNGIDEDCSGSDLLLIYKVYPNPTRDQVTIHIQAVGLVVANLYDFSGRKVLTRQLIIEQNQGQLDLGAVSPGVYALELLKEGERVMTSRIIRY